MWKKTSKQRPVMAKTVGSLDDTWWHSDLVIGQYTNHQHHSYKGANPRYKIVRYEVGNGWKRWYCPVSNTMILPPDYWSEVPEEK